MNDLDQKNTDENMIIYSKDLNFILVIISFTF